MKTKLAEFIATMGGAGYLPKAPGTWGSLLAVVLAYLTGHPWLYLLILTLPGIWAAGQYAKDRGSKDPQSVVIDEGVGQWIALSMGGTSWQACIAGFLLFRLFDIVKPWPVRQLEGLPGGWGIVMDDAMAGVYAGFVMLAVRWFNLIS